MILSEQQRRWSEIKYYYFCMDLYHINHDMIEVILLIEAVAHLGKLDYKLLKSITAKMLGDPYYLPARDEVISLAYAYGLTQTEISKQFDLPRVSVSRIIKDPRRNAVNAPIPLLDIVEDQEMYRFCQLLPLIQKAGIHEKETKN